MIQFVQRITVDTKVNKTRHLPFASKFNQGGSLIDPECRSAYCPSLSSHYYSKCQSVSIIYSDPRPIGCSQGYLEWIFELSFRLMSMRAKYYELTEDK